MCDSFLCFSAEFVGQIGSHIGKLRLTSSSPLCYKAFRGIMFCFHANFISAELDYSCEPSDAIGMLYFLKFDV